jgi:hypothetical protein
MMKEPIRGTTRRQLLGGAGAAMVIRIDPSNATPASMKAAIRNMVGKAQIKKGKVHIDVLSLNPGLWTIGPIIDGKHYSIGMPRHPSAEGAGWSFDFPQADGVHYVSTAINTSLVGKTTVRLTFDITGDAATIFHATQGASAAKIKLFMQRPNDDWQSELNRWWSTSYVELGIGSFTLIAPLRGNQWSSVLGKRGDADATAAAGFAATISNVENIGMTFGGDFAGHGVYATGAARFIANSYVVE